MAQYDYQNTSLVRSNPKKKKPKQRLSKEARKRANAAKAAARQAEREAIFSRLLSNLVAIELSKPASYGWKIPEAYSPLPESLLRAVQQFPKGLILRLWSQERMVILKSLPASSRRDPQAIHRCLIARKKRALVDYTKEIKSLQRAASKLDASKGSIRKCQQYIENAKNIDLRWRATEIVLALAGAWLNRFFQVPPTGLMGQVLALSFGTLSQYDFWSQVPGAPQDLSPALYGHSMALRWEILPKGLSSLRAIVSGLELAVSPAELREAYERLSFIQSLDPSDWYRSTLANTYLIARFPGVTIAESFREGNALYYLFDRTADWRVVFQCSKVEARRAGARRIIHREGHAWQSKLKQILKVAKAQRVRDD